MFKKRYLSVIVASLLLISVFFINYKQYYKQMRSVAVGFMQPVFDASHFVFYNVAEGFDRVANYGRIYREHEQLKQEVVVLRRDLIDLEEMRLENARLRELLNFEKDSSDVELGAEIIGRDVSSFTHWAIVNAGQEEGALQNMPLVAPGGLVGRIVTVNKHSSQAVLLADHQSKVSSIVQRTRETGILTGTGKGLQMKYIPVQAEVKVGDVIVTSGLGGIFPKGIPIGKVTSLKAERNGLHLYAEIEPFVDYHRVEEVLCLEPIS